MNPPSLPGSIAAPTKSGLAIASLILGIVGIALCFGPVAGVPAVICGHLAQSKIKASGGTVGGAGLATAGLITGYLSIAWIFVIGMLAAIAIPNFVRARTAAQTAACQANLRMIQGAKESWAADRKKNLGDMPAESDLFGPDKYIHTEPGCPAGGTYTLNSVREEASCTVHGSLSAPQRPQR